MRGALIASSQAIARERGLEADYFAHLPAEHRAPLSAVIAQAWIPMELAMSHYAAMGHLFPSAMEQLENGRLASERTQNAWVKTIARALNATGNMDVPSALKRIPSGFERMVRGGQVTAYRTGPKDARVELAYFPFVRFDYARNAWQGMFESAVGLMATRLFVRQDLNFAKDDRMALKFAWV
jgi:hypothetical protein